ncbi:MAG: methyltransferase RsmF C-terminal domain-like protein [Flavobacteriales bacterium]
MNLPSDFVERTCSLFPSDWSAFVEALNSDASISVRINEDKINALDFERVPWCATAYQLSVRPQFTLDPLIHAGAYYVQEANSMFIEEALRQITDVNKTHSVLDLCAAPGGKTTLLSSLFSKKSIVVANEVIKQRAGILKDNVQKWGRGNVVVTSNDAKDFGRIESFFDVLVADLPCSGEGMFRKDPKAIAEWSPANVQLCAERQKRIIASVWPSIKNGGHILYSTCTFNEEENEKNIDWICENFDAEVVHLSIKEEWGIVASKNGYRFYPHKTPGEGFFLSVLRKKGEHEEVRAKKIQKKDFTFLHKNEKEWTEKFVDAQGADFLKFKNFVFLFGGDVNQLFLLSESLYIMYFGVEVGELLRDEIKPASTLVYSSFCNKNAFDYIELSQYDALRILKKENIVLPQKAEKNWIIFTFKNVPIALAKNIGNRINNYFPKEWVIRMNVKDEGLVSLG